MNILIRSANNETLPIGTAVQIAGQDSETGVYLVIPALATYIPANGLVGGQAITQTEVGELVQTGKLANVLVSSDLNPGDAVWLSATLPGKFTKPSPAPGPDTFSQLLAWVLNVGPSGEGALAVNIGAPLSFSIAYNFGLQLPSPPPPPAP